MWEGVKVVDNNHMFALLVFGSQSTAKSAKRGRPFTK
jgi:hypothetical protein